MKVSALLFSALGLNLSSLRLSPRSLRLRVESVFREQKIIRINPLNALSSY